jgi:hypothetical protein
MNKMNHTKDSTIKFITNLLDESKLSVEYFEINYADKIQPDIYEILVNNIKNVNKLLSVNIHEKNSGLLSINDYKQNFGFASLNESMVFYCQDIKEEIFNKTGTNLEERMKAYGIPLDRLTFASFTSLSKKSGVDGDGKISKKREKCYEDGKGLEILSLERFNYSSNLQNDLTCLVNLPNLIFYFLPLKRMYEVKDYLDSRKKNIMDELNYNTEYYGYNEIDGILMNDTCSERKIPKFDGFEIRTLFNINNKSIKILKSDNIIIRPYTINFIEVKTSFNHLKARKQVLRFLNMSSRFISLFCDLKLNIIEKPKLYDMNQKIEQFPKVLSFDLFFVVDNEDRNFEEHTNEIISQINEFLLKNDLSFDFQLIFSSKKLSKYDLSAIHNSRISNMNNIGYHLTYGQREIINLKNEISNLKRNNRILFFSFVFLILFFLFYFLLFHKNN